ncbi:MAG: DUF255 domain-containing protein [Bacteroidia bacterium]|nr:DUF255 domain-containing protein [Bacteroidia bacterium]
MKKPILFFLLLISTASFAGGGINFSTGNWNEIRAKAKAEGKYIFLDGFTEWCYWCKVMDKQTFPDKTVTDILNSRFISVQRDMEREEGKQLSMKYHIASFPTYIVFSPEGELVYTIVGFREPADFVTELMNAMTPTKHEKRPGLNADLDPGYPEFYKNAFGPQKERKPAKEEEIDQFLDAQTNLLSEVAWSVMWRFPIGTKHADYLLANRAEYARLYGKYNVDNKVQQILLTRVKEAGEAKDDAAFNKIMTQVEELYPGDKDTRFSFNTTYYQATKNWAKYAASFEEYAKPGENPSAANFVCWTLYEECDDKAILEKAVGWMKEAVQKEPSYALVDTYAALLYKTGNYAEAEKEAKRAIDLGEKEGEKTDATKELLDKIRAAKKGKK